MSIIAQLNEQFPIRRTNAQKEAFRAWFLQEAQVMGFAAREDALKEHRNLVVGDPLTARVTFTAHYDTPATFFFANLMTPRNRPFFWLRQVWMILALIGVGAVVGVPVGLLAGHWYPGFAAGWLVYMACVVLMRVGPANPHNVNDNTSGVAAVLETMGRIPAEKRAQVAFILFDNEEKGCLGSKAYAKAHPAFKQEGFLVNLDCVGDGEHILLLASKQMRSNAQYPALCRAMEASRARALHIFPLESSVANSDQKNFKCSAAVLACGERKGVGYCTGRIHTKADILCDQGNLDYLADGFAAFINTL